VEVIERAKDLFPGERITMALGGFHLKDSSEDVIYSIAGRFRELGVEKVAPAHCSGEEGMNIFSEVFKGSYISAGAGKSLEV
jgi:7,8-dihydropterin-6-yl-methyl-4-(beta-D-ribofuranosyl)aminobenzene 5'-phosphate synthase